VRRVAVIATASGCGKTTFGRALARLLGLPFSELDAIHWQAGWTALDGAELRRRVEPIVAGEAWVIDGSYRGKLGDLVLEAADTVVWLDLPLRVWLPRLLRRTFRRAVFREVLWNGNRESLRSVFTGRDSLIAFALRTAPRRRQRYPHELAGLRVARLRTRAEVRAFLRSASRQNANRPQRPKPVKGWTAPKVHQSLHKP
jgi:adenylate kinase family enzyme